MFVKSDIRKIAIAFDKAFYHEVYLALGRAGLIHLTRFEKKDVVSNAGLQSEEALTREIISSTSYALNALQLEPGAESGDVRLMNVMADAAWASGIKKKLERASRIIGRIREKEEALAHDIQYADALDRLGVNARMLKKSRMLYSVFGTVENADWLAQSYERFILSKAGHFVFGLTLPAYAADMLHFLKENGFTEKSREVPALPSSALHARAEALRRRREAVENYIAQLKKERGQPLEQMNADYRTYEDMLRAMRLSVLSSRAIFVTGWMDAGERAKLLDILQSVCGGRFIFQEQKDPDAPVRLRNMRLLKPFELLVRTMGMPAGNELDPTPLTAITYVLMFGLMFGDLGQGLVLAVCGFFLKRFGQKKFKEELAQAGGILIACGASAAVCGLLYGSFFSSENIFPALWFHPTGQIMRLFFITIMMGAAFITIGLCLNIINSFINADFDEALLEKKGLAILTMYAAIIYFAVDYQKSGRLPESWSIGIFIGLPLAVFAFRGMLGAAFFQKPAPHRLSEYIVETVMEMVEIALSLFANTISFIRVGAFALSHAGLSIVTYTLAGMADPSLTSPAALLVIVCGNIFIIGFEGLICGIQSMRLEYYEFFSKFFKGDGVSFAPFTLKAKGSEV